MAISGGISLANTGRRTCIDDDGASDSGRKDKPLFTQSGHNAPIQAQRYSKVDNTVKNFDYGEMVSVLANLGVIAGILFLGFEIRQNTLISRGTAVQSIAEQVNDWQIEMASNDHWIRIQTSLNSGGTYSELSAEDQTRYLYVVTPTIRIMENRYRQVQLGIIDPSELEVGGGKANTNWYRSAHFAEFWHASEADLRWSPDFIEFMETQVMAIR